MSSPLPHPPLRPRALSVPRCALNVLPEEARFFASVSRRDDCLDSGALYVGLLTFVWLFGRFLLVSSLVGLFTGSLVVNLVCHIVQVVSYEYISLGIVLLLRRS